MKDIKVEIPTTVLLGKPYELNYKYKDLFTKPNGEFVGANMFVFPSENKKLGVVFLGTEKQEIIKYKDVRFVFGNTNYEEEIFTDEIVLKEIEVRENHFPLYLISGFFLVVVGFFLYKKAMRKYESYKKVHKFKANLKSDNFREILKYQLPDDPRHREVVDFINQNINKKDWNTKGIDKYTELKKELGDV